MIARIWRGAVRRRDGAAYAEYMHGFRRVGVMREYWRSPDGAWRDGLLLELLASELER